ncbi:acyl carrier protein [Bremerella sp.]|uniref:acyl carrier protein n=1 Tax=Bremerella sp. TaxID=2795602 RepID=UPI00391C2C44
MPLDQRTYAVQDREVFEWLREKISQTRRIRPENVQMNSSLAEDLVPDSFELIELVCEIEKKFGFTIDYDDFAEIESVSDVVDFIQHRGATH